MSLNSSLVSNPVSENLHLQRFAVLQYKKPSATHDISVVSLGTSLVLLAALVEETQDLSLQIWDLSYGVLLAAQSMPMASAFSSSRIHLTVADEGEVLLTVSPARRLDKQADHKRSSIYTIPVHTRLRSNLASALGKAALTAEWLVPNELMHQKPDESTKIISAIHKALKKGNAQKAEAQFLKWVDSHSVGAPSFPRWFFTDDTNSQKKLLSVMNLSRKYSMSSCHKNHPKITRILPA